MICVIFILNTCIPCEILIYFFCLVPVSVNITTTDQRYPLGSDIELPCSIVGYPLPQVEWFKDGIPIEQSDRIRISGM